MQGRIDALEKILVELKNGFNPNYQDMAVLEAVRGWEGLSKNEPAVESSEGETKPEGEVETSQEEQEEEEKWPEHKIHTLKDRDAVTLLLEHEQHVSGKVGDEVKSVCKWLASMAKFMYLAPHFSVLLGRISPRRSPASIHRCP
jgi:protein kinase C substrate 80K-H